jgi:hypothetical protein
VVFDLQAAPAAPDVTVVIEVRQVGGHPVFLSRSLAGTASGSGRLTLEIPSLNLLGGDYDIAVGLHEPGDTAPGVDRLLSFSVAASEGAEGIADLRGAWSFSGTRVEVSR